MLRLIRFRLYKSLCPFARQTRFTIEMVHLILIIKIYFVTIGCSYLHTIIDYGLPTSIHKIIHNTLLEIEHAFMESYESVKSLEVTTFNTV